MLPSAIALLPTPTVADSRGTRNATAGRTGPGHHDGWTLSDVAFADRWAQYGPAIRRWETALGRPAPEPTVTGKRGGQRLSGRFTEWLMGLPDGWVSDLVDNNAAVRICGNGVVPQQAIAAYSSLAALTTGAAA
jgi:DNA (cytosine-5)-methyltransferase 1